MRQFDINDLLLKTAFSCMACDGSIDEQELTLLKKLHNEEKLFGEIELSNALDELLQCINENSQKFLHDYFVELDVCGLSEVDELKIIEVAIDTIRADEKIEYSEIKFFKIIRSKLRIDNDSILAIHPDYEEFLAQDIKNDSYSQRLQNDYMSTITLPIFTDIDFVSIQKDINQGDEQPR
ncbi:hypothetical protein M2137_000359 [Parabacteroides sp. PFB2-10]|uniref:tellurite resistance TerB family protein n=1 Tax=Parabacteroides sp. PFB2-10 TaxID=1742405 RepID=UPI0024734FF8|nr:hypothetical protein [Parabacteroides sp. PFB2-10]MDH6311609.1 hypothetical protein [Parabacteroides sp. PFB2-10]